MGDCSTGRYRIIDAMIASTLEDRKESKVQYKMLQQTSDAPGTIAARVLWVNILVLG